MEFSIFLYSNKDVYFMVGFLDYFIKIYLNFRILELEGL